MAEQVKAGVMPHEFGMFVRSTLNWIARLRRRKTQGWHTRFSIKAEVWTDDVSARDGSQTDAPVNGRIDLGIGEIDLGCSQVGFRCG